MQIMRMLVLAFLASLPAAVFAAGPGGAGHGPGPMHHGFDGGPGAMFLHPLARAVHRLDLDDAQKTRIDAILADAGEQMKKLDASSGDERGALHEVLISEPMDKAALEATAKREGELLTQRIIIGGTAANAVLGELSEEQRTELRAMHEEFRDRMRQRFDREDKAPS